PLHAAAVSGLRRVARLRRTGEIARLAQGQEIVDPLQLHDANYASNYRKWQFAFGPHNDLYALSPLGPARTTMDRDAAILIREEKEFFATSRLLPRNVRF